MNSYQQEEKTFMLDYLSPHNFILDRHLIFVQYGRQSTQHEVSNQTTVQRLKEMIADELCMTTENMDLYYKNKLLEQEHLRLMKVCHMDHDAHPVVDLIYG